MGEHRETLQGYFLVYVPQPNSEYFLGETQTKEITFSDTPHLSTQGRNT